MSHIDNEVLAEAEHKEILSLIPDVTGLDLVDLSTGNRLVEHLSTKARSTVVLEISGSSTPLSRESLSSQSNVTFIKSSLKEIKLEANSADMVLTDHLLKELSENEIDRLLKDILSCLRPGGYLLIKESCSQDNNADKSECSDADRIHGIIRSAHVPKSDSELEHNGGKEKLNLFEILLRKRLNSHVKLNDDWSQMCWLLQKTEMSDFRGYPTFQEFLENNHYTHAAKERYEWVFEKNFISHGGVKTTEEFTRMIGLKPGQTVLDIGCGFGGAVFYIAEAYDVNVTGIDLSQNNITVAESTAREKQETRVQFETANAVERNYPADLFDAIYSRDVILHIKEKDKLFHECYKWLKPGGRLVMTDYCCSEKPAEKWCPEFLETVNRFGFLYEPIKEYVRLLTAAGFKNVKSEDRTAQYYNLVKGELDRLHSLNEHIVKVSSQREFDDIVERWSCKARSVEKGDHTYGLFMAEK